MNRYIFVILNPTRQKENLQILKSVYSVKYKDKFTILSCKLRT